MPIPKVPLVVGLFGAFLLVGVAGPAAAQEAFSALLDRAASAIDGAVETLQGLLGEDSSVPEDGQAGLEKALDGMANRDTGLAEASDHLAEVEPPVELPAV